MLALIALVAACVRLAFFLNAPVFFEGDARGYLVRAVEIGSGDGFQFSLKRTPGYPLLIAGVFAMWGPSLEALVLLQHVFGVITAVLVYDCARRIAGRAAGLIAGLATALSGSMLIYEHVVLTESLFTLLLVATLWLVVLGIRRASLLLMALAGIMAGASAMFRPIGLMLALTVPVFIALLHPSRRGLVSGGVCLAAFGLVLAPWVLRNELVHGEAAPVHPGRFLVERTINHNETGVLMYDGPNAPGEPRNLRAGRAILRELELERPTSFEVHSALVRRMRLSDAEASNLMWDLAVDAIRRKPDVYLYGTWIEFVRLIVGREELVHQHVANRRSSWRGAELRRLQGEGVIPELLPAVWPDEQKRLPVAEALAQVYQPSRWIGFLLLGVVLAGIGAARDRSRRAVILPVAIVLTLALGTVLINGTLPRYRYPFDPLLHIAAAAGIAWTLSSAFEHLLRGGYVKQRLHMPSPAWRPWAG